MAGVSSKIDELLKRGTRDEQVAALCGLGRELLAQNDVEGAHAVLDRAVQRDSGSATAWALRAEILAKRNRTGEALGSFDRALTIDPKHATAIIGKGDLLLKIGSHTEAIECYEAAVKVFPDVAHIWLNRARAFAGAGREVDAIASVDRALRLSDAPPMWLARGDILAKIGNHDEAKLSYERAVLLDPSQIDAWFALALSAAKANDITTAKRACYRFLNFGKADDPRIATMRSLLFQLDRHGTPPQVSGVQPRRPPRRLSSSRMRRLSSRALKAIQGPVGADGGAPVIADDVAPPSEPQPESDRSVAEVEDDDDGFEDTLADLIAADALYRSGRHVEALRKAEALVKAAPKEVNAWVLRSRVLIALTKHDLAAKSAEEALALDDTSVAAWKLLARAHVEAKRLDRAADAIARAEKIAPKDTEVHRLRADSLVASDRHTEAVLSFEKALMYAPSDPDGWLALGRVLRLLRRTGPAKEALEKARDLADSASRTDVATEARGLLARLG